MSHRSEMEKGFGIAFVLLPTFAALGPYLNPIPVGSVAIYGFRQLLMLLMAISCCMPRPGLSRLQPVSRAAIRAMMLWLGWACVSLLWAPSFSKGMLELSYIVIAFAMVAVVNWNNWSKVFVLEKLCIGWTLSLIPIWAITLAEYMAGRRLFGTEIVRSSLSSQGILFATFYNTNDLSGYLVLTVPFVLMFVFQPWRGLKRKRSLLWLLLLAPMPVVLFMNGSRISMVGLFVELAFLYVAVGGRDNIRFRRQFASLVKIVLALFVIDFSWSFVYDGGLTILYELNSNNSSRVRLNLILNGIWMLWDSFLMGVGPAGFSEIHRVGEIPYSTMSVTSPHCFLIEVLAQYGIVVFIVFFHSIFSNSWKKHLGINEEQRRMLFYLRMAAAGFFFSSFSNSGLLMSPTAWTFIASFVALNACFCESKKKRIGGGG